MMNMVSLSGLSIGTDEQWVGVRFTPSTEGYVTEIDFGLVSEQLWNTDELNWEVRLYDSLTEHLQGYDRWGFRQFICWRMAHCAGGFNGNITKSRLFYWDKI